MSVTLYDDALLRKIKFWVKDNDITILGVNESTDLFQYRLDRNDDKPLQLPIISLSRDSRLELQSTTKQPSTYDGLKIEGNTNKTNQLNFVPVRIRYQLDIYTRYNYEAQEFVRNFIFNFINYPGFGIEIPYNNSKLIMNAYIHLEPEVQDNSDIPERLIRDSFSRQTISFYIDGQLFDYKSYDNWKIDCCNSTLLLNDEELELANNSIDINIKENK